MDMLNGQFKTAKAALDFMFAGNAAITLRSQSTGVRYTYRISQSKDNAKLFFVSMLSGADNESDYTYIGLLEPLDQLNRANVVRFTASDKQFRLTRQSRLPLAAPPVKGFLWTFLRLSADILPEGLEIWHEGRCGRCGRKLTVPESVESGFGPECIKLVGGLSLAAGL